MKIGVISDTHGLLRPEALECLAGVKHIIHAGDIGSPDIVPRLRAIASVTAIRGNVDTQDRAREYPAWEMVTLGGRSVYVIHVLGEMEVNPAAADIRDLPPDRGRDRRPGAGGLHPRGHRARPGAQRRGGGDGGSVASDGRIAGARVEFVGGRPEQLVADQPAPA